MSDNTLVLVKPDGVRRGLIGEIIRRFERRDLTISMMELRTLDRVTAEQHYAEHSEKPFFGDLVDFIIGGPLVAMVVSGREVVPVVRKMMGETDPAASPAGSIRGDLAIELTENLIHGSDSPESAEREIRLFFPEFS